MSARVTKQGVRNLNPIGVGDRTAVKRACRHWFGGPWVVTGKRWAVDIDNGDEYLEPVYGKRCTWCLEVQEEP